MDLVPSRGFYQYIGLCLVAVTVSLTVWSLSWVFLSSSSNKIIDSYFDLESDSSSQQQVMKVPVTALPSLSLSLPSLPLSGTKDQQKRQRISMEDMTCYNFTQPLDHFNPRGNDITFSQRICTYDYMDMDMDMHSSQQPSTSTSSTSKSKSNVPIFFYTGNESPIDEYVNNTGLMFELGSKFKALIVFVEHRFQGTSIPNFTTLAHNNIPCFTHLTTAQALADYATIITKNINTNNYQRPLITFGGSYGGMLSVWMKIKYGSIVAGSIASSAPIWGLPKTIAGLNVNGTMPMDGAAVIVGKALMKRVNQTTQTQTQTHKEEPKNYCFDNLLATWPLIKYYGTSNDGRKVLKDQFKLCNTLEDENDVMSLLDWAQSPWFNLAEGDYPYPSSYIPYALGKGLHKLPAWPLQEACHGASKLNSNFGVTIVGSRKDVKYDIIYYGKKSNIDDDDDDDDDDLGSLTKSEEEGLMKEIAEETEKWVKLNGGYHKRAAMGLTEEHNQTLSNFSSLVSVDASTLTPPSTT